MKSGKKASGGRYKNPKKKGKDNRNRQERTTKIGKKKIKLIRTKGGNSKLTSTLLDSANIIINKKAKKTIIKNVLETPSNTFLARQNILIKGAIIETELGKARITNRPSQEGQIQAIILKD